jgi:hypothetical protein
VLGQTAFIKVPEGWQQGKFKTKTGYLFFTALGPIEHQNVVLLSSPFHQCLNRLRTSFLSVKETQKRS